MRYVGYDCVRYFEPKTARDLKDVLQIPESLFMLFDTIVAFDRFFGVIKVITFLKLAKGATEQEAAAEYRRGQAVIENPIDVLNSPRFPEPEQKEVRLGRSA